VATIDFGATATVNGTLAEIRSKRDSLILYERLARLFLAESDATVPTVKG